MAIPGEHDLDAVAGDLCEVRVINSSSTKMSDVAMATLVGADV